MVGYHNFPHLKNNVLIQIFNFGFRFQSYYAIIIIKSGLLTWTSHGPLGVGKRNLNVDTLFKMCIFHDFKTDIVSV